MSEITDAEWITYDWLDVSGADDAERRFVRMRERTPEESYAVSWNITYFQDKAARDAWGGH